VCWIRGPWAGRSSEKDLVTRGPRECSVQVDEWGKEIGGQLGKAFERLKKVVRQHKEGPGALTRGSSPKNKPEAGLSGKKIGVGLFFVPCVLLRTPRIRAHIHLRFLHLLETAKC
jgi:hypothetical protein